jgi:hypothetical protein
MDLTNINRIFYPTDAEYTFFSAAHGTFSKIDHNLSHKANLSKYKKVEILSCILSDHNRILDINSKRSYRNSTNTWRLSNILSNDQWVIEEIREGLLKIPKIKLKYNISETVGCS